MRVFEGQALGALTLLIVSITVYGITLLISSLPVRELSIPWVSQGAGLIAIEIVGNRGKEGIYFLKEGTTVGKLGELGVNPGMRNAGGFEGVTIYAGSVVDLSGKGEVITGKMAAARMLALGLPVDLNNASDEDLALVPGLGENTAYQIIQLRNKKGAFRDISELMSIPGIKEKKLNGLKKYLIAGQGH